MNLYPLLNETQKIAIKLREQAAIHNNTKSGRFLESLNHKSLIQSAFSFLIQKGIKLQQMKNLNVNSNKI